MNDDMDTMRHGLDEIEADWPESSLDEQQNYVIELDEMAADASAIHSVPGTNLLRDVGHLRDSIARRILPARQKRDIESRLDERTLPGERL